MEQITPTTRLYNMAYRLMTDYGINIYDNKTRWDKCKEFCSNWPEDATEIYFSNAVFFFACKIQKGEI